ncbi:hypothetical protein L596_001421 [Steinernema carpocapsae]|uniref:Uncharacterized protein n=1 Tax=Steinernema carpocapsae TaxID=34508 RepID=A0A4U8ULQ3_STECR|nr:hypothetical protein L596_001421 [Steinernema carpocapsae]
MKGSFSPGNTADRCAHCQQRTLDRVTRIGVMVQNRISHSVGARNGASRNTVAVQEHENGQRFQHVGQRFPKEREVGAVSSSPIREPSAGHKCQDSIPLTGSHAKRMNPALEESMHSNYDAQQRARLEQQRKEQEARNHAREVLQRDRENATFSAKGKNGLKTRPRYSVKASMQENRKPGVQASTRGSTVTSSQNAPDAFDQIFECQVKTLEDLNKPKDGTPKQEYSRSTSTNSSPLQKCRNICPSVPAPIALGGRRLHQIEQTTVENLSSAAGGRGSTVEQKHTNYVRVPPKSDSTTTRSGRQGANSSKKLSESRDASLPLESSPKSRLPLSSQPIGSDQRKQPRVEVSPSNTGRQESPQDGWRVCERDRQTEAKSHRSRSRHRDEISSRRHREHRDTSSSQPDLREIVSVNHGRERYRSPLEASSHRLRLPLHNQPSQRHRVRRDTQSTLPNLRGRDADSNTLSSRSSASSTVRQQDSRQSECWKVETSLESETPATHIRRDLRFDVRPDASAKDFESFETGKFCSIDDQRGQVASKKVFEFYAYVLGSRTRSRSEERLFKTMQTVFDTPLKGTYSNHMEKVDLEHALYNQAANNRELLKVKNSPKKEQPTSHWASRWDVRPTATDAFSVASEGARKRTLSASANVKSGPKTSEENVDKQEYGHKVQKKLEGASENGNGENDLEEGDVGAEYEIISVAPGQVRYRSKWTTAERYHSKNQNEFSMEMDDGDDQNIEWDSRLYVSNQPDLTNESAEKINRSEVLGHTEIDEKEYLADGKMGTNSVDEEPLIHEETDSSMETDESPSPGPGIAGDVDNRRPLRSAFQKLTEGCDSKNEGVNAVKDSSMEADDLFAENVQTVWNLCEPQQTENDNNVLEMDCEKSDSDSDASPMGGSLTAAWRRMTLILTIKSHLNSLLCIKKSRMMVPLPKS